MKYFISIFLLFIFSRLYFIFAKKFRIVDVPNYRSSHDFSTVRGGGILFPVAVFFWYILEDLSLNYFVIGLFLVALVSFIDDIRDFSRLARVLVQLIAVILMFFQLDVFTQVPLYMICVLLFFVLGIINAVNFMDGINGITGLYSLVFFFTVLMIYPSLSLLDTELIYFLMMGVSVFLFYNFRRTKAVMFAGDVGSVSIAYVTSFFLIKLYLETGHLSVILLLLIYGVDSVLTIFQRLYQRENIFEPHRNHLYQLLVKKLQISHLWISCMYAAIQLAINYVMFISPGDFPSHARMLIVLLSSVLIYTVLKVKVIQMPVKS